MATDLHRAVAQLHEEAQRLRELAEVVIQSAVRRSLLDAAERCERLAKEMEEG